MSESTGPSNSCPKCGAALPSAATAGLCPRCLMARRWCQRKWMRTRLQRGKRSRRRNSHHFFRSLKSSNASAGRHGRGVQGAAKKP